MCGTSCEVREGTEGRIRTKTEMCCSHTEHQKEVVWQAKRPRNGWSVQHCQYDFLRGRPPTQCPPTAWLTSVPYSLPWILHNLCYFLLTHWCHSHCQTLLTSQKMFINLFTQASLAQLLSPSLGTGLSEQSVMIFVSPIIFLKQIWGWWSSRWSFYLCFGPKAPNAHTTGGPKEAETTCLCIVSV